MGRGRGRSSKNHRLPSPAEDGGGEAAAALPYPLGAEVEVRSDDPGFLASFYEATVDAHLPDGAGYLVSYCTLLGEDGGSPLRERAAAFDVRPRPPHSAHSEFAMYEMVEAFHNDGWWSGVVSGVPPPTEPKRVYTVAFPTAREVLQFEAKMLRPNLVFKRGRWVLTAETDHGTPLFREGNQVEVSRSTSTFGKSWYPATVLKVINVTIFLVQYRHAGEDGELATEILDSHYIRPARTSFQMDSKFRFGTFSDVEVFHEGSWWPGVILEVSGNGSDKKYVIEVKSHETGMDEVEGADLLVVENTLLRPRYNWNGKKWVRCSTKRPSNRRTQSTSSKRPNFPVLLACSVNDEIGHKASSYPSKKARNANAVLALVSHTAVPSNAVLALGSQKAVPLQASIIENRHLKYDSSLSVTSSLELPSSQRTVMPSELQTKPLQASLFGVFGQLRPLTQGPVLGMQSVHQEPCNMKGTKETLMDQEKQSTNDSGMVTSAVLKNFRFRSLLGTDVSKKKRKERVAIQALDRLGKIPEIMQMKKRIVGVTNKEGGHGFIIFGKSAEQKHDELQNQAIGEQRGVNDIDVQNELPNDVTLGHGALSEQNELRCADSTMQEDNTHNKCSQENSATDNFKLNGQDDLQQDNHIRDIRHDATEASVPSENSPVMCLSTLVGNVNMLSPNSPTQDGNITGKAEECAMLSISKNAECVEQNSGGHFSEGLLVVLEDTAVDLSPSTKNYEAIGQDHRPHRGNMSAVAKCAAEGPLPIEEPSGISVAVFDGVVVNLFPSTENCETNRQDDMVEDDQDQGVTGCVAEICPQPQHANIGDPLLVASSFALEGDIVNMQTSTKNFGADEQHDVSQQDHTSAMVECVAEGNHSMDSSAIIQFSCVDRSKSIEAGLGDDYNAPKDAETTPTSKKVASKEHGSSSVSLQKSLVVYKSIMGGQSSGSLATCSTPFVKTSMMWEQIEAMEIFSEMPQQPNFLQLQYHVPEFREGMALGLMLAFAKLAESIKRLHIQDDKALFEEKLNSLSLLEANGFDIRPLRSRLEMLLHIRDGCKELHSTMEKTEEKIVCKEADNRLLDVQIDVLTVAVRELEQQCSLFHNIRQSLTSQKIDNTSEILRLKMDASKVEQSNAFTELRFSSVAAAPW